MLNMDEAVDPTQHTRGCENDRRAAASGMPLADFECRHGRLAHDRTPPCGCFPQEARRPILHAPILPATTPSPIALTDELDAIAAAAIATNADTEGATR